MKKLLFALALTVLVGCTCIGQIPDQIIYVGEDCTASLPNYLSFVTVRDNCEVTSVVQLPEPGLILDSSNPVVEVEITATDNFDNSSSIVFNVLILDTIPPVITLDSSLMSYNLENVRDLYKATHYYMAHSIQQAVDARPDSALEQYPILAQWDTIWDNYNMVTFYPKGGEGTYLGTFYSPGHYLCSCDSTAYYAQADGGTIINLNFQ